MENLINIGTIVGTHHLRGSVKINSIFENIEIIENERVLLEKNEKKKLLVVKKVKRLNEKKAILDFEIILSMQKRCQVNYTGSCSLNLHNLQVLAFCVPLDASVYRRGIGRDNSKKKKKNTASVFV